MFLSKVDSLKRAPNHSLWKPHSNVYFKLEGNNASGSQKHRVSHLLVRNALEANKGITVGSCGNLGYAIALNSLDNHFPYKVFVPKKFQNPIVKKLLTLDSTCVSFIDGTYEDAVYASREFSHASRYFDANPVEDNRQLFYQAYEDIAREIVKDVSEHIGSVWLVGGNGTTLVGLGRGFKKEKRKPLFGVVSSLHNSALTLSLKEKRVVCLNPSTISETEVNEPLVNWNSFSAADALEQFNYFGGFVYDLDDAKLLYGQRILLEEFNIHCQPASSGALIGFLSFQHLLNPHDAHIIILTS